MIQPFVDEGGLILLMLTLLIIKHFVADFVLQTTWMVDEKRHYGRWGGLAHSGIHGLGTGLIFLIFGFGLWSIICAVIDFIVHYHTDWVKMNASQTLTVVDRRYWVYLGLDQMIHYLTYIGLVMLVLAI